MKDKKKEEFEEDFSIDQSQYEVEDESKIKPTRELEETETVPIEERKETIHFPWAVAIIIGVLMVLIIACIIVIKVLEGQKLL